jgi:hypothetical protein
MAMAKFPRVYGSRFGTLRHAGLLHPTIEVTLLKCIWSDTRFRHVEIRFRPLLTALPFGQQFVQCEEGGVTTWHLTPVFGYP